MLSVESEHGSHLQRCAYGRGEETTGLDACSCMHGALLQLLPCLLCYHLAEHITHQRLLSHFWDSQGVDARCGQKVVYLLDRGFGLRESRTGLR